tara:strand:- start:119 stop:328 length:210 start_codon:yes stop_codon:yes gene_type:complete
MNPILLDFEKLIATIKNDKNNLLHLDTINNMVNLFEIKYNKSHSVSTHLLVLFLRKQFKVLETKLYKVE